MSNSFINEIISAYTKFGYYALRLEKNPENAEDLLHDSIIRMIEKKDSFYENNKYTVLKWGMGIMHNLFIDKKRKETAEMRRIRKRYISEIERFDYAAPFELPRDVILRKKCKIVKEKLKRNGNLHELFVLRSLGLSYKEICEKNKITMGTVKARIHEMKTYYGKVDFSEINTTLMDVCA